MCLKMLPAKFLLEQLTVIIWYSLINSITHLWWSGMCYCLLPKYLYLIEKVLDVFQVLVLANVKKYFYLTQVLWKVLDPNPGCNSCNLYLMWTMSIQDAAFWYDLFIRPKWCTWNNMWGHAVHETTSRPLAQFDLILNWTTWELLWAT